VSRAELSLVFGGDIKSMLMTEILLNDKV